MVMENVISFVLGVAAGQLMVALIFLIDAFRHRKKSNIVRFPKKTEKKT